MLQHPGSSWGFSALLKDTSVVVLKEERALVIHSPTNNHCRTRDSNPQPLDYESNSLTIRPRLPHVYSYIEVAMCPSSSFYSSSSWLVWICLALYFWGNDGLLSVMFCKNQLRFMEKAVKAGACTPAWAPQRPFLFTEVIKIQRKRWTIYRLSVFVSPSRR